MTKFLYERDLNCGCGGNDNQEDAAAGGRGGVGHGPVTIIENPVAYVDTDNARCEYVTECDACSYYNRGECGRSGLAMAPDDYCSKAAPAEA